MFTSQPATLTLLLHSYMNVLMVEEEVTDDESNEAPKSKPMSSNPNPTSVGKPKPVATVQKPAAKSGAAGKQKSNMMSFFGAKK